MEHRKTLMLTQCALIAALAYIGFQFLRIDIPVGTERTAIHLGNTFVVLGALLLGGWGGFAGAMGLTIADLTSGYITSAPKTFLLKLAIGLITTLVARKLFHIEKEPGVKAQTRIALFASLASLGCNVVLDPLFGYFLGRQPLCWLETRPLTFVKPYYALLKRPPEGLFSVVLSYRQLNFLS